MKRNTRQAYAYILADSTYRIVRVETSIITLGKIVSPRVYRLSLKFSVDCTNEGCQNLDTAVPVTRAASLFSSTELFGDQGV